MNDEDNIYDLDRFRELAKFIGHEKNAASQEELEAGIGRDDEPFDME